MRPTSTRCRCDERRPERATIGRAWKTNRLDAAGSQRGSFGKRDAEREFDDEFWSRMSGEERVSLLWDMVLEVRRIRGEKGDEPRLQRSVLRVERREVRRDV